MIQLGIAGIPQVQAAFQRLASDQLPFALSVALNGTAFAVRNKLQARIASAFDRPTPLIKGANRVKSSTKETLTATVYVDPRRAPVLYVHETGGRRGLKGFERAIGLSGEWRAVPTDNVAVNAYGNVPQATIKKIVAAVQKRSVYFVVMPGQRSHLQPGIYQRKGIGLTALFLFRPAVYRERLQWEQTALGEARRLLPIEAAKAVQRAIETARP